MSATLTLTSPTVLLAVDGPNDATDYFPQPDVRTAFDRARVWALLAGPDAVRVLVDGYAVEAI